MSSWLSIGAVHKGDAETLRGRLVDFGFCLLTLNTSGGRLWWLVGRLRSPPSPIAIARPMIDVGWPMASAMARPTLI